MGYTYMELHTLIIQGLLGQLQATLGCPAYFVSTTDRWRLAKVLAQLKEKNVALPLVLLKINTFSLTATTYNPRTLKRRGMYGNGTDDGNALVSIPMLPVDLQFEVIYLTTDFYDTLKFASDWMFAATGSDLNMTITYHNVDVDIKAQLETTIQVPEKDNSSDIANLYEMSASLTVNGYVTDVEKHRTVDMVRVIQGVTKVVGHDVATMPQQSA